MLTLVAGYVLGAVVMFGFAAREAALATDDPDQEVLAFEWRNVDRSDWLPIIAMAVFWPATVIMVVALGFRPISHT